MRMMIGTMMAAVALVGCSPPDSVELEHRSTSEISQARGVELQQNGEFANVGMLQTTCDVDTANAMLGDDYDYGNEAIVVDGEIKDGDDTFLVLVPGSDTVGVTTPGGVTTQQSFAVSGDIVGAQIVADGIVTVTPQTNDCAVATVDNNGQVLNLAQLGVECSERSSVTSDMASGTTWISTDSGVYQVSAGQVTRVSEMPNALLSHDAAADVVYAGIAGQSTVAAIEPGGFERWSTQVDGTVSALTDMGERGSVAVSVQLTNGGAFVILDGATGAVSSDLPTPSAASGLNVAANGAVLAVTLPNSVIYFDVNELN